MANSSRVSTSCTISTKNIVKKQTLKSFCLVVFAFALVSIPFPSLILNAQATEGIDGYWRGKMGVVLLTTEDNKITGKLIEPDESITLPKDTVVFEGVLIEDSLSGKLRLDAVSCKEEIWGFGVFLFGEDGKVLSGSVNYKKTDCKIKGLTGDNGLYMKRVKPLADPSLIPDIKKKKPVLFGPKPAPGSYDPSKALKYTDKTLRFKEEGKNLLQAGKFEQARESFKKALNETPNDPVSFNGIGVTYYARNMYKEALDSYKKALTSDPNFRDAYYNMACIYAIQEKPELAIRYLKIAAMNGFADVKTMAKDPDLHSLHSKPEFQTLLRGEY